MRMTFRCKNCGKMMYFHDRIVAAIVAFMNAKQLMWETVWDRDFGNYSELNINSIVTNNARCCDNPKMEMLAFHGFE